MTNHIETLRSFIASMKNSDTSDRCDDALASLTEIEKNYLPLDMLPEGWVLYDCKYDYYQKEWRVNLRTMSPLSIYEEVYDYGKTPHEAFMNAFKEIG